MRRLRNVLLRRARFATRRIPGGETASFERDGVMATCTISDTDRIRIAELVVAAQAGDRDAFGELFESFERQVFAIALRRLGDFCEAQELCQDVFVQAMLKLDQLRDPVCFGAWIRSIAHRMAINRAVRRRNRPGYRAGHARSGRGGYHHAAEPHAGWRAVRPTAGRSGSTG